MVFNIKNSQLSYDLTRVTKASLLFASTQDFLLMNHNGISQLLRLCNWSVLLGTVLHLYCTAQGRVSEPFSLLKCAQIDFSVFS